MVHHPVTLLHCRIVKQQTDPPPEYNLPENRDLPAEFAERLCRLLDNDPVATSACIAGFSGGGPTCFRLNALTATWEQVSAELAAQGIDAHTLPIEAAHVALADVLSVAVDDGPTGLVDENLQSRIRGVLLMALSNAMGWMVLTTGNKSESAVGYSTLYGDTAGAYAVIKDVYKTRVYDLCRWRNAHRLGADGNPVVPVSIIAKAPSAELRPDQRDDQSLPPYEVLDPLLEAYVEGDRTRAELVADGHDPDLVDRVVRLVDAAEFKRRQTPLGPKVTTKGFGRDRRMPIVNHFRG